MRFKRRDDPTPPVVDGLRRALQDLETIAHRLAACERPGHVDYISKAEASQWLTATREELQTCTQAAIALYACVAELSEGIGDSCFAMTPQEQKAALKTAIDSAWNRPDMPTYNQCLAMTPEQRRDFLAQVTR